MRIQNFEDLATSRRKRDCLEILESGLQAADPRNIIPRFVTFGGIKQVKFSDYSGVYSVAFGKAGDSMTQALNAIIPVKSGIIVIPKGSRSVIKGKKFQIFNPSHPRPDRTSVRAAKEVMKFVQNKKSDELVIFLVSGGASSLLALPDQITLNDKARVTDLMLKSGATIQEFNCIRKHLSRIKGGKLVQDMKCSGIGLIISDVEGDDLSSIASGTTHMDNTTYGDALNVLERYGVMKKIPEEAVQVLKQGSVRGDEQPKKPRIENLIVANNEQCISEMQKKAESKGYHTTAMQVFGDIKGAVTEILSKIPEKQGECLIFGGETTVKVLGKGAGGRNQEIVLRLLKNMQKMEKMTIASMGTDGIDGNSVFAGAITDNSRTDVSVIKEFLRNSDSARFFQKHKANIITGPTHTNLMDIGMILR